MTRRLRVRPEAEAEIDSAVQWYESKRPALGAEFMAALDNALDDALAAPEASPVWRAGYPFRKYVVRRFPYVVLFTVTHEDVEVVAVAHAKRRAGYWLRR